MSNYPTVLLSSRIAEEGDKTIPPATSQEAGTGRLSQAKGWTEVNSTSISAGGIPPKREDTNGVLWLLSQFALWQQQGGLMNYSTTLAYEVGNEVLYNGVKYRCLQANGGDQAKVTPGTNPKVWKNMDSNVPAGCVMPFFNVKLGTGDNARNPIFWGETEPDESWVICDGGTDGSGGTVPNLVSRFIKGSTVANAGQTGGNSTQTLTQNMVPSHTHTVKVNSSGAHTHTRGTMEITGEHGGHAFKYGDPSLASGAFFWPETTNGGAGATTNCAVYNMSFQASRNWTGETSSSGSHTHTATCEASGGSGSTESFSIEPPYYQLAYFVKLPDV